jgi:hypothetical protein
MSEHRDAHIRKGAHRWSTRLVSRGEVKSVEESLLVVRMG